MVTVNQSFNPGRLSVKRASPIGETNDRRSLEKIRFHVKLGS